MVYTIDDLQKRFNTNVTKPVAFRIKMLNQFERMLKDNEKPILEAVYKDLRRNEPNARMLELQMVYTELSYHKKHIKYWVETQYAERQWSQVLDTAMIKPVPKGVCLVISPWNFPILLALQPFVSLIASGCVGILKPSEVSSHCAQVLNDLFSKYMDPQYYQCHLGGVKETTEWLQLPFDHIFYTGSTQVGKIVMRAAAEHLSTVTLELGGANYCFVDKSVNLKSAATRIAWIKSLNCGQICLSINALFIPADLVDEFLIHYKNALQDFYGEDIKTCADYGRIINERHFDRIAGIIQNKQFLLEGQVDRKDLYIAPTVIQASLTDEWIYEELFAPVLPIVPTTDFDKVLQYCQKRPKPLCNYIFSHEKSFQEKVMEHIVAGNTSINDVLMHVGYLTLPFGGVGASGQGQYHGKYGFDAFTNYLSVLKRPLADESMMGIRYPPLTEKKMKVLQYMV